MKAFLLQASRFRNPLEPLQERRLIMYHLHIANKNYSSWSLRPWVLLKVLDIPFEEILHFFASGYGQNTDFTAFSPTGLVPCLIDGKITVWESLAIVEYLAESFPAVWPDKAEARAYARSAASQMHAGFSNLRNICSMTCGQRIKLPEISTALQGDLDKLDALLTMGLTRFGGPYLAGDRFTAVDAFFCPVAFRVQSYGLSLSAAVDAYLKRLLALEPMQDWYNAALNETAREQAHEDEIAAAGEITADYRQPVLA
jgi:glutathione S-transferase